MRIWTKAGDLAFKTFTFPDGQPHFKLETYEVEFRSVTVETSIRNPIELFQTVLVNQVLRQHGYSEVNLDIRYLLGARMDRAIGTNEPFTLECVARIINSCGFSRVRILDAHSEVATRLIRNSVNVLPHKVISQVRTSIPGHVVACPDKGAKDRTRLLCPAAPIVYCSKVRDMVTGTLTGFKVDDYQGEYHTNVLIVDDICDGGGTFVGLAKELRAKGAKKVYLFCTHTIFSKGVPLEGINHIYTTDSYNNWYNSDVTTIPISMKDL